MTIDLRAPTPEKAEWVVERVQEIAEHRTVPRTAAKLTGGITRAAFPHDHAACGLPTLDGLGPVGANGGTRSEDVVLGSPPRRTALLAGVIAETSGTRAFDLNR